MPQAILTGRDGVGSAKEYLWYDGYFFYLFWELR